MRREAVILTTALIALYALLDFTLPGDIAVAALYSTTVVAAARTRSARFLWFTTFVCIVLAYVGLAFGRQPPKELVRVFYIDRSLIVLGLLFAAAIIHRGVRQSLALEQAQGELRRANNELETRVTDEVSRRTQAEHSLQQAQKMEIIGQLAGGIAHDFNNVLTAVIGNLEIVRARCPEDDPRRRLIENALLGAKQGTSLTGQLLGFARRKPAQQEMIDVERAFSEATALARPVIPGKIQISTELGADVWQVFADRAQLQSALLNLMINARDAMPDGGCITLSAHNGTIAEKTPELACGDYVQLSVSDTGCGMPPEVIERAFEPLFTTKGIGKGTGLGLPMVHKFAEQCGGSARIESAPGRGTTVHIYLPRGKTADR